MHIWAAKDYEQLSLKAAGIVAGQVALQPDSVLGLATGSTPLGMYRELVKMYSEGWIDFSRITTFNLDEYLGLGCKHEQSYHHYMYSNFLAHINIPGDRIHIPNGLARDVQAECNRYERAIENAGGIELQILGIGHNGHIGFNEPGEELPSTTHTAELKESTIEANSRFFSDRTDVPTKAISMGIATILKAHRILLLCSGKDKAEIIACALQGRITTWIPASLLQLHHRLTVIVDRAAAAKLPSHLLHSV